MRSVLALLAFTNPAWAACDAGEITFMSCQIENSSNVLRVCYDDRMVHYRFGPADQMPELALSETIGAVNYSPWPGVGQAIWEEVQFRNNGIQYTVHAGFDRMFDEEEYNATPHHGFGGVRVTRVKNEAEIVSLACERASVDFDWDDTLFLAKNALGFVWDDRLRQWIGLPD